MKNLKQPRLELVGQLIGSKLDRKLQNFFFSGIINNNFIQKLKTVTFLT